MRLTAIVAEEIVIGARRQTHASEHDQLILGREQLDRGVVESVPVFHDHGLERSRFTEPSNPQIPCKLAREQQATFVLEHRVGQRGLALARQLRDHRDLARSRDGQHRRVVEPVQQDCMATLPGDDRRHPKAKLEVAPLDDRPRGIGLQQIRAGSPRRVDEAADQQPLFVGERGCAREYRRVEDNIDASARGRVDACLRLLLGLRRGPTRQEREHDQRSPASNRVSGSHRSPR